MFIVHVFMQVKPDCLAAFREASIENARHSIQEPGVVRFDFIQQRDDPTQFVLAEVYRTEADIASHKRTRSLREMAGNRGGTIGAATVTNLLPKHLS